MSLPHLEGKVTLRVTIISYTYVGGYKAGSGVLAFFLIL